MVRHWPEMAEAVARDDPPEEPAAEGEQGLGTGHQPGVAAPADQQLEDQL